MQMKKWPGLGVLSTESYKFPISPVIRGCQDFLPMDIIMDRAMGIGPVLTFSLPYVFGCF